MTPTRQFYIRSHGPNPAVDAKQFRVEIEGLVENPLSLSVSELTNAFAVASCICTVSCAGIRRMEFSKLKPVKGVQWAAGPIGNATWSGVRLSDVLKSAGVKPAAKHVWFEGADTVQDGAATFSFGGSIPVSKALDDVDGIPGALLATQMNGEPLLPDHGFPLRSIVPGFIGARSVKWLRRITVSEFASPNHFVADAYKLVPTGSQAELDEAAPIYRYPVNAAACSADRSAGRCTIRGYALPAGFRDCRIVQVDVSLDNGTTWKSATLTGEPRDFCWQLWEITLADLADADQIIVRATDSHGHTMPAEVPWNAKGYLYNGWHRATLADLLAG